MVPLLLQAHTMTELFEALKHRAQTKSDEVAVQKAQSAKAQVTSKLYPEIDLFGRYDHYTIPTSMVPVPPDTMFAMIQNPSTPQPFSQNIYRLGASISMPVFVKSIYTYADRAEALQRGAAAKKRINRLKNEALIVGTNATLLYLETLEKALDAKARSLGATRGAIAVKVENGRAPASELYKIDDALNQNAIAKNGVAQERLKAADGIERLTGIALETPVAMRQLGTYRSGEFAVLEPQRARIEADRLNARAAKEKLYPALSAKGSYVRSYGASYNNDTGVYEGYGSIGVVLNIPVLKMQQYEAINLAELETRSAEIDLEKQRDAIYADAHTLEASLPLLKDSIALYGKSVGDKKRLRAIAEAAYKNGRLSVEEYLRYEDAVVESEANLNRAQAQQWQTLMQLAVIYGNNIEEIVQ
jgi:outer membrane protein TolC